MATKHDKIAEKVAKALGTKYNPQKGPDIVAPTLVGEVETDPLGFTEGIRQLQGFRKPRYLVVPKELVLKAQQRTAGLKTGVMSETGRIVKSAKPPARPPARGRRRK